MKKLKNENALFKEALLAGVKYAEGRGMVEFEPSDSASEKLLYIYRLLVPDKVIQPLPDDQVAEPEVAVHEHRLAGRRQAPEEELIGRLTARELDVVAALVRGRSNKEIALELGIGLRTIESYVSAILNKLGVRSRTEATIFAIEHHLASPRPVK